MNGRKARALRKQRIAANLDMPDRSYRRAWKAANAPATGSRTTTPAAPDGRKPVRFLGFREKQPTYNPPHYTRPFRSLLMALQARGFGWQEERLKKIQKINPSSRAIQIYVRKTLEAL